ncbi:RNA polymerase sigma factor [Actinoplanes sp. NPDC049596]|uniref:RNA polymerase sigma factor n=1 Tax=unclassified Actinoplanes TaxID=2626549 RepID=UPI0034200243
MATSSEAAFAALYRAQYEDVRRFVSRRAHPSHVDDVVAETFLAAWRRYGELPAEPRAWLFGVARNNMLNAHRGAQRQQAVAVRIAAEPAPASPDRTGQVDDRLDVAGAWRRLDPRDQEVLALHVWDGLSGPEAAAVLGCSRASYAMRLTRSKRRLARALRTSAIPAGLALTTGQE